MKKLIKLFFTTFLITCGLSFLVLTPFKMSSDPFTVIHKIKSIEKHGVLVIDEGFDGGICTGTVLKNDWDNVVVLTAKHCIGEQPDLYIESSPVHDYEISKKYDLALLYSKYKLEDKTPAKLSVYNAQRGEELFGLGYSTAEGYPLFGTQFFKIKHNSYVKMSVKSGCSGSGLFNKDNELVGTIWGGTGLKLGVYTPISYVRKFFREAHYVE